ncbi:unnamed protein product [Rotaria socialis]|uniref:Fibronectin type III-like domain-containing protein n=1 Tax=Rotaria socialis TaxID=392032 RepID=A0A818C4C3_9BILA|nr:unnamed protein product [Rotaria socialis]CAF4545205.1 unnamed protein product [Rotaria socialis]
MQYIFILFTIRIVWTNGQSGNFPDCKSGPLSSFPICNQSLPSRQRAVDLISRMTIMEKISYMITTADTIPRLGLPKYEWWSEALHGLGYSPGVVFGGDLPAATSFPMPINIGATFNMRLVHDIANIISTEARAFNNEGRAGLTFFTPNINIFRDPRWGRGQETPGEDPFLTSQYVYALIEGLQRGDDERYLKIAANCKHFDAYDLENWNGTNRHHFDAKVTDQDLVETYLPSFKTCIQDAQVASIMCSYNSINGIPACAHQFLLETIARESFHLNGFVVSDCGAIGNILYTHHYTSTVEDTVAVALHAGTDLECGVFYLFHLYDALNSKKIVETDIDQSLMRTLDVLIRLGWFDPPEQQIYRQLNKNNVDTLEARQLSLISAQESIVLLKNVDQALPLNINLLKNKKIALIGPTADATVTMQGIYHGQAPFLIDPVTGFKNLTAGNFINIEHARGCEISSHNEKDFAAAIELARSSDIVFFFGGIDHTIEREGVDRKSIDLPDIQLTLIKQLEKVARSPLHVVIMSGGGVDLSYIRDSTQCGSLLWIGYPGQSGGLGVATVVFGQYNPAGRLPVTIYPASYVDEVSMFDMQMRSSANNPGRTYKFYTGKAVYEFGYGLSYTTFNYTWNNNTIVSLYSIQSLIENNHNFLRTIISLIRVNVTNTGNMAGDDVVLAYVAQPNTINNQTVPFKQLFGFERIHLAINETKEVFFPFTIEAALAVTRDGSKWLYSGLYRIFVGQQQHMFSIELRGQSARLA